MKNVPEKAILHRGAWPPIRFWDGRIYDIKVVRVLDGAFLDFAPANVLRCCEIELCQRDVEFGTRHFLIDFYESVFAPFGAFSLFDFEAILLAARQWIENHLVGQMRPLPTYRWGKAVIVEYRH